MCWEGKKGIFVTFVIPFTGLFFCASITCEYGRRFIVTYKSLRIKVFLLIFTSTLCFGQEKNKNFWEGIARPSTFGKPFWADMHSTLIRAEIGYATNSPDYDWGNFNSGYRPFIFANLGVDIPLWSGNFSEEKYGLSITLPFMIDVWFDRFEWVTSPIINTAYRFGAPEPNFIYNLDFPLEVFPYFNIYNWTLKLSFFKHESTHIGDELTIHRTDLENLDIIRIDVASNYFELIFTVNDPDGKIRLNHGLKFGFLFNYKFKDGWYTVLESEMNNPVPVGSSRFPFEIFIQYQFQSPLFYTGFQIIASAEYRLREQYNYPYSYSENNQQFWVQSENTLVNCFNLFAGIRYVNQNRNYFSKIGIGVRYYSGINPYGQFRSMPSYRQMGIAVIFE